MTERLYYTDAETREFEAHVLSCTDTAGRIEVVLDRTAFYPTSGGQPFDTGTLNGVAVREVIDRDDGTVAHVVSERIETGAGARGIIDWARRFDHMQQHSGQHILSGAFDRVFGVRTVSFHMGAETSTIDLGREVTPAEIASAEEAANRVVWEDRPVRVRFVSAAEAATLPLRKEPAREGPLRLVEVEDFDLSACGGTHVRRTGAIGIIAVSAWERMKGGTRVTFVCGRRALESYRSFRDALTAATRVLSVTPAQLAASIEKALGEAKDLTRTVRGLHEELAAARAAEYRGGAETIGTCRAVLKEDPRWEAVSLRATAAAITGAPGLVAVLVGGGDPAPVVVSRSADVAIDAADVVRRLVAARGGRGGGRPELAQAGLPGPPGAILNLAREVLASSASGPVPRGGAATAGENHV